MHKLTYIIVIAKSINKQKASVPKDQLTAYFDTFAAYYPLVMN